MLSREYFLDWYTCYPKVIADFVFRRVNLANGYRLRKSWLAIFAANLTAIFLPEGPAAFRTGFSGGARERKVSVECTEVSLEAVFTAVCDQRGVDEARRKTSSSLFYKKTVFFFFVMIDSKQERTETKQVLSRFDQNSLDDCTKIGGTPMCCRIIETVHSVIFTFCTSVSKNESNLPKQILYIQTFWSQATRGRTSRNRRGEGGMSVASLPKPGTKMKLAA